MKSLLMTSIFVCFTWSLYAHVEITYPTGGMSYTPGNVINIQWEAVIPHNTLNYDLFYSRDDGNSWESIITDISPETFHYNWIVPAGSTAKGRIKVIQDNSELDYEGISGGFTIENPLGLSKLRELVSSPPFPNPFTYSTNLYFMNPGKTAYSLFIYNDNGQLVRSMSGINSDHIVIYRENLDAGSYYYQLWSEDTRKKAGKLLIR